MAAGYSKRPLIAKLGIKPGQRVAILNPPDGYEATLGALPADITVMSALPTTESAEPCDFIHFFCKECTMLAERFPT